MIALMLLRSVVALGAMAASRDASVRRWRRAAEAERPHANACLGLALFGARRTEEAMPLLMHAVRQDAAVEDCVSLEHVGAAFSMAARKLATLRGHVTDEARALRQSAHYFARADAARAACRRREEADYPQRAFSHSRAQVLRGWGDALAWLGDPEGARRVFTSAGARALWPDPLCRPVVPLPERAYRTPPLRPGHADPPSRRAYIFDAASFAVAAPIVDELLPHLTRELELTRAAAAPWRAEAAGLHSQGQWETIVLRANGRSGAAGCALLPAACAALDVLVRRIPALDVRRGQVKLSRMAPGTVVRPHAGPSNGRLRMHCGVHVNASSGGATGGVAASYLRVGDGARRTWRRGECFVFREACEHAVAIDAALAAPRTILIVDFASPFVASAATYAGQLNAGAAQRGARAEYDAFREGEPWAGQRAAPPSRAEL
jgi:hypothetical protein